MQRSIRLDASVSANRSIAVAPDAAGTGWSVAHACEQLWAGEPRWGYAALGAWAYPAQPAGCSAPVTVVERRGNVGGIQARNLLVPARGLSLIAFTNAADFDFGEVWQGQGFTHDLLAAALCPAAPAASVAPPAG